MMQEVVIKDAQGEAAGLTQEVVSEDAWERAAGMMKEVVLDTIVHFCARNWGEGCPLTLPSCHTPLDPSCSSQRLLKGSLPLWRS